jgi:putrescine transport system ATP-binding protein
MTMADRIGVMDRGQLVQVATPSVIYEQPATRWVAQFIGDVNLIEGRVSAVTPDGLTVESDGAGSLQVPPLQGAQPGANVWIALRPEKVRIAAGAAGAGVNCCAGEVVDIAYLGDMSIYKLRLDSGLIMKASAANATRLLERPIGWGERVRISWAPDAAVLLTS